MNADGNPMKTRAPHALCGAMTRNGTPCRRAPLAGSHRCRLHGGTSPIGASSPHFKHGRYSQFTPARIAAGYETARGDDDLLTLADEVALLQARVADVLSRVDAGDSRAFWNTAAALVAAIEAAQRRHDAAGAARAFRALRDLFATDPPDAPAWREVLTAIDSLRRVSASERKRIVAAQAFVTAEEAMLFASVLWEQTQAHVTDPAALARIQRGFRRILAGRVASPMGNDAQPPAARTPNPADSTTALEAAPVGSAKPKVQTAKANAA